jgi:YebC/PmpR family DNA-binding regulatory protein
MSGHSKWATTKRHKAAIDSKRGKIFSALSKDITLAAKASGGDPASNARLRTLIEKAKAANMPNDNVDRAIKKGTGEIPGVVYEEMTYEGFAHGGVGFIIQATTDNKQRAVAEVRAVLTKHGGNLATAGALAFTFHHCGQFLISAEKTTEEKLMEVVLDAGAEDIKSHGDHFEVICPISAYDTVSAALSKAKITADSSEIAYLPVTTAPVKDADTAKKVLNLIEQLEAIDDVKNVFTNAEIDENVAAAE